MCNSINSTAPTIQYPELGRSIQVATIFEKQSKQINLKDLDSSEVTSLKTQDPFLYYSIPAVMQASRLHQDVDVSAFDSLKDSESSNEKPNPAAGDKDIITRKSKVSFESYPDFDTGATSAATNEAQLEEQFYAYLKCLEQLNASP